MEDARALYGASRGSATTHLRRPGRLEALAGPPAARASGMDSAATRGVGLSGFRSRFRASPPFAAPVTAPQPSVPTNWPKAAAGHDPQRVLTVKPVTPSTAPDRGALTAGAADALRRRVRSIASLVEIALRARGGDLSERLDRQILVSVMGVLGARSGAHFGLSPDGRATLRDCVCTAQTPPAELVMPLPPALRLELNSGETLRPLGRAEAAHWLPLTRLVDPGILPSVLVRLEGAGEDGEFMLFGNLEDVLPGAGEEHALRSSLAGLIDLIRTRGARSAAAPAAEPHAAPPGEAPAEPASLAELRRLEPALRRFVGVSPAIESVLSDLIGVAGANVPILFEGESGTGKEQLARIAHELACGEDAPFEAVNCGAIPEALVESELFGHAAGAFTGASRDHRGVFERAGGGTVFLDEIAEMPLAAQVKLLRVLQEGTFSRVGGEGLLRCGARIIAATNRDLKHDVAARRFRQDLFYRLNVFPIRVPPLRERREDIPLLVNDVLDRVSLETGQPPRRVDAAAMRRLSVYAYPGNVRELQNIVRALSVEARGSTSIGDTHVISVFSRHRLSHGDPPAVAATGPAPLQAADCEEIGRWVLAELRRYYFNLALAERMLEDRRRTGSDRRAVPVFSRSGLTYYMQGECFRALAETGWDRTRAAARVAGEAQLIPRVRAKLDHFLDAALETLRSAEPERDARLALMRARFAKLPECYAPHLRQLVDEFHAGRWN